MRGLWIQLRRLVRQVFSHGLYPTFLAVVDKIWRLITQQPIWRFTWVSQDVLLGAQPARTVWPMLMKMGVTGVVNMRHEHDYRDEIGGLPLEYLYLPTVDQTAPSLEHLKSGAEFIERQHQKGGKVYVHCWEGQGRAPTMAATFFVSTGDTPDEAWARIRKARPFVRPTKHQRDRLVEYALTLKAAAEAAKDEIPTEQTAAEDAQLVEAVKEAADAAPDAETTA